MPAKLAQKTIYLSFPTASPLSSRAFKFPAVSVLFVISTDSGQNRGSVCRKLCGVLLLFVAFFVVVGKAILALFSLRRV